jgi:hypothetical protein
MTTAPDHLPPHYHALRLLWTVLQVVLLLVVLGVVAATVSPGDVLDWAGDL